MRFTITHTDTNSLARVGEINTAHGAINTPCFMPVGTQASVKTLTNSLVEEQGAEIILANTYHLYLRPGHNIIAQLGGLHQFMRWQKPILTDSGGFQIYSLASLRKVTPAGVFFQSHIDGSSHLLSPELAIEAQCAFGVDIMMCLDECTPYPATSEQAEQSLTLTAQWAKRCKEAKGENPNALFGIVQGGMYPDLRRKSVASLLEIGFDGYALGGLSVGEPKELMKEMVETAAPMLPADKPRYLMGVGFPADIVHAVGNGIDMFDCVIPTRCARNGLLFTNEGNIAIGSSRYLKDKNPLDNTCDCYTCRNFSRAYLRHLYVSGEITAMVLNTIHNLRFYMRLMEGIRTAIKTGAFAELSNKFTQK
ncbi:MAG: tRNA guanosine(34) transglycosylase Tgt [Deltaproteobacteria bacterium]|nr:tRNA guanosine(34) transglycosylase Tgt [Deltaproteobacteria bacterium]